MFLRTYTVFAHAGVFAVAHAAHCVFGETFSNRKKSAHGEHSEHNKTKKPNQLQQIKPFGLHMIAQVSNTAKTPDYVSQKAPLFLTV